MQLARRHSRSGGNGALGLSGGSPVDLVAWVAREMNKTAVKDLLHIAWATVGNIVERVVARKLDRTRLERLYHIGIDEVSYPLDVEESQKC